MANAPRFQLQNLDYEALMEEAELLAQKLLPDWDFANINDSGRFIIEVYLAAVARHNLFVNNIAHEFTPLTAFEDKMVRAHAKSYGYTPPTATPSETTVAVTTNATEPDTIAKWGLRISSAESDGSNARYYENAEAIALSVGADLQNISFREGQVYTDSFAATGLAFQQWTMTKGPFILESVAAYKQVVTIGGVEWTEVTTFIDSSTTDTHYVVGINAEGKLVIYTGDGVKGAKPASGAAVTVQYRVGGGLIGKVKADKLTTMETPIYEGIVTAVNNAAASTGGQDKATTEHIKAQLPMLMTRRGQLNSLGEVVAFSEAFAGIERAKAILSGNQIHLYCLADPVTELISGTVLNNLETAVADRLVMGYGVDAFNCTRHVPTINVTVYTSPKVLRADIEIAVERAIRTRLDPLSKTGEGDWRNPFGGTFKMSRLGFAMQSVENIYDYIVTLPVDNVELAPDQVLMHTGEINVNVLGASEQMSYYDSQEGRHESSEQPVMV